MISVEFRTMQKQTFFLDIDSRGTYTMMKNQIINHINNQKLHERVFDDDLICICEGRILDDSNFVSFLDKSFIVVMNQKKRNDKEKIENKLNSKCVVCFNNYVTNAFIPCGHTTCCEHCVSNVKTCPICRSKIKYSINVRENEERPIFS